MDRDKAIKVIETLLYMTDHALTMKELSEVLEDKQYTEDMIQEMVQEVANRYELSGSPLRVVDVAGGVQMATRPDMAPYIRKLYKERLTVKLSNSALETLSIIAYKQPITRSEIEQIRGVEASGVMETLLERRLVKVVGRKETIGRPILYGTTLEFLKHFGLKHLSELPDLESMISSENQFLSDETSSEQEGETQPEVLEQEEALIGVSSEGGPENSANDDTVTI